MLRRFGFFSVCVTWIVLFGRGVLSLYERDVDLAAVPIGPTLSVQTISVADSRLAQYVFPLGDINGDGIDDVIMSWSTGNLPDPVSGGAYVLLGSESAPTEAADIADFATSNSAGFKIIPPAGYAAYLEDGCLSGGGDFNNDGFADILVGVAKLAANPNINKGILYVIYGHNASTRSFVDIDLSTFTSGPKGYRIIGAVTSGDKFAVAAASAGDFNSDGFDDIVACAPRARLPTSSTTYNVGACYVIFGKPNSQRTADINLATFSFTASTGFVITGDTSGNMLGYSTAGGFDFNGDGRSDVAIGDEFGAYILFGRGSAFSYATYSISTFASSTSVGVYIDEGGEGFGWGKAIVSPGDVNGDGIDDILLNALYRTPNVVAVIYGSRTAGTSPISIGDILTASPLGFVVSAGEGYDLSGTSVGDANGDGINDLMVALPYATTHGRLGAGYVYIVYGQNLTTDREPQSLLGGAFSSGPTTGMRIYGAEEEAFLGNSFNPAGDLNHDGKPDVMLATGYGQQVYILSLVAFTAPPPAPPYDVDIDSLEVGPTFQKVLGTQPAIMDACSIGDFNGDGIDDLFVAAMLDGATNADTPLGGAYVLFGATTAPSAPLDLKNFNVSGAGFRIVASDTAYVGPVGIGGDYNNDGFADVMVVDPSYGGKGAVFVIYGHNASTIPFDDVYLDSFATGPLGFRILGAATGQNLGGNGNHALASRSVSTAGDFNSDGFDDILVCAPTAAYSANANAGVCYVIFGKSTGARQDDVDLAAFSFTASTGFKIQGNIAMGYLGIAVRGGFDFNHDGHDDILLGDPNNKYIAAQQGGGAFVLYGRGSSYPYASFDINNFVSDGVFGSTVLGPGGTKWGSKVEALGDVNGDGVDDVVISPLTALFAAVVFGSETPQASYDTSAFESPSTKGFMIVFNSTIGTEAGMIVAPAGDANGDGVNDILVSLQYESPLDRPQAGIVYVIFGKTHAGAAPQVSVGGGFVSSPATGVRILGSVHASNLATSLRAGGDFNHDGRADLLLVSGLDFDVSDSLTYPRLGASQMYILNLDQVPSVSPTLAPTAKPSTAGPSLAPVALPTTAPTNAPSIWHDIDMNGDYRTELTSGHALLGAETNQLGGAISAVGDFNGDGIDDLLVGAPGISMNPGGAYLILGSRSQTSSDVDLASFTSGSTSGVKIIGPEASSLAGGAASGGGDFNNDGFTDIIIGARSFQGFGAVYVIYGHNATTRAFADLHLDAFTTSATGFIIYGAAAGDGLGSAVSNAGDVNSDDFDDIIVCSPGADPAGSYNGGICYVIFGRAAHFTADLELASFSFTATTGFKILGSGSSANLGGAVSGGFDFNKDGHSDVIVGSYGYSPSGRSMAGAAFVIFGHPSNYVFADINTAGFASSTGVGVMIMGDAENNFWGPTVASVGDVNNDGVDDVVVSAASLSVSAVVFGSAGAGSANVDLLGFTPGTRGFLVTDDTNMPLTLAGAGDVNGDGIDDLLVASPQKEYMARPVSGVVNLVFGRNWTAPVVNVDLATFVSGQHGVRLFGSSNTSNFGQVMAGAGDLNGDGLREFAVSSDLDASYGRDTGGKVYLLTVAPALPSAAPTLSPSVGPSLTPTSSPTSPPSVMPTASPSYAPSAAPTPAPTSGPTAAPSLTPTASPTVSPSARPTATPSLAPTMDPAVLASVLSSPTYKVRNGFAFAVKSAAGKVLAWGEAPHGGALSSTQSQLLSSGVVEVVPGRFTFTALLANGSMLSWGVTRSPPSALVIKSSSLVANEASFAAVTVDGDAVVAFGSNVNGGNVRDEARCNGYKIPLSSGVSKITASAGAFAALKTDGTVYAWGNTHVGGGVSTLTLPSLVGVSAVFATRSAFAALLSTGAVVAWGDKYSGGDVSAVSAFLSGDIVHVIAGRAAFVAFTKSNGLVVWGHQKYGGDVGSAAGLLTSNVKYVAQTFTAMAAVKFDGSVVTWGKSDCGGDSSAVLSKLNNIVKVVGNGRAFAALNSTGGVVAWGKPSDGGTIPADKAAHLASGVVSIHHTDRAFAALRSDGRVVVWGQAGHGGSPGGAVEGELASGVHTVCANDAAFSAIKFDGNVVGWGHAVSIPSPGVLFNSGLFTSAACA